MFKHSITEEPVFFTDSEPLYQDAALAKHDAWQLGNTVMSSFEVVGQLPAELGVIALSGFRIQAEKYRHENFGLYRWFDRACSGLLEATETIVIQDAERSGLHGRLDKLGYAGNFGHKNSEVWHADNSHQPIVRWTAAFGIGSTIGSRGEINPSQLVKSGDLRRPSRVVGPGKQLDPVKAPEGSVVRFMTTGDIHRGPHGNGPRVLAQISMQLDRT